MAGKSSKVVIIDATTKTLAAASAKAVPATQKTAKPVKSAKASKEALQKPSAPTSSKTTPNNLAAKSRLPKVEKKTDSKKGRVPAPAAKDVTTEAPVVKDLKTHTKGSETKPPRVKKSREFVVKLRRMTAPEITRARMRAVAYVGVTYVLLGVCTASYALAQIYHTSSGSFSGFWGKTDTHMASTLSLSGDGSTSSSGSGSTSTNEPLPQEPIAETTTSTSDSSGTGSSGSGDVTTTNTDADSTVGTDAGGTLSDATVATTTTTTTSTTNTTDNNLTTTQFQAPSTTLSTTLTPEVTFSFSQSSPFSEKVYILIRVRNAEKVELGIMPRNGLTPLYLGKANYTSGTQDEWRFAWDTKNVPNGEYYFGAQVTNRYGTYPSPRQLVAVFNPLVTTSGSGATITNVPSVTEAVTTIEAEMESTLVGTTDDADKTTDNSGDETTNTSGSSEEDTPTEIINTEETDVVDEAAQMAQALAQQIAKFKESLLSLVERFAVAYRAGDTNALTRITEDMETLKTHTMATLRERQMVVDGNYARMESDLDALIAQEIARIETRERMIVERVGDGVALDSDSDGIVDYDEIHLYQTDPKIADSDSDGFIDGAEILSGYNPTDPQGEVVVAFESPETEGPERADLLSVASINTERAEDGSVAGARLTGTGLPNSFVTLYVFSTPVVVTVRTGEDGSWSYVFDKELEDGTHTVYVGITDNAGRIVAKSSSFSFVKTAEAFTGAEAAGSVIAPEVNEPELISANIMLLVSALSLTLLGLALVALGAYFMRPREHELVLQPA